MPLVKLAAATLLLQVAACASNYSGPITNAPATGSMNGPPLLTNQFAP